MSYLHACLNEAKYDLSQVENAHADLPVSTSPNPLMFIIATSLIAIANCLYVIAHLQLQTHGPTTTPPPATEPSQQAPEVPQ